MILSTSLFGLILIPCLNPPSCWAFSMLDAEGFLVLFIPLDCAYNLFMDHLLHHASKENEYVLGLKLLLHRRVLIF